MISVPQLLGVIFGTGVAIGATATLVFYRISPPKRCGQFSDISLTCSAGPRTHFSRLSYGCVDAYRRKIRAIKFKEVAAGTKHYVPLENTPQVKAAAKVVGMRSHAKHKSEQRY